jgi:hypothetical protein
MTGMGGAQSRTLLGVFSCALLGWVALARAEAEPAPAEPSAAGPSNDDCLGCHNSAVDRDKGKPIPAIGEAFTASVHGPISLSCTDCHADLQGKDLPHEDHLAKPTCSPCHDDAVNDYAASAHAQSHGGSSDSDAPWCSNCHGVHDIRSSKDPASPTYHFNLAATCGKCHANAAVIAKAKIKIGNVPVHFQDSIHARALNKMGLLVAPNCASCHGNHEIRRASDAHSPVNRSNVSKTCGTCHEGVRRIYETSVHGAAVRDGKPDAAICTDCHSAHDQKVTDDKFKAALVKECGTCHKQELERTFHGDPSKHPAATCADCHGSHDVLPKTDPKSLVSAGQLAATCGKCHKAGSVQIMGFNPHVGGPRPRPSRVALVVVPVGALILVGLYWIRRRRRAAKGSRDG